MIMQSIFRLPWAAETLNDKPGPIDMPQLRAPDVTDLIQSKSQDRKRKRTDSVDDSPASRPGSDAKRMRMDLVPAVAANSQTDVTTPAVVPGSAFLTSMEAQRSNGNAKGQADSKANPTLPTVRNHAALDVSDPSCVSDAQSFVTASASSSQSSTLRSTIEHHCNLEILLKHREFRLIEQELAKCQVALEQLRRCELIPFPGSTGLSTDLSSGTFPSLRPQGSHTSPSAPAPWGVTDGPYTRHYAKWLIPDPMFDPLSPAEVAQRADASSSRGPGDKSRSTRNSVLIPPEVAAAATAAAAATGTGTGRRRTSRDPWGGSVSAPSSATPSAMPTPTVRGRGGPLVIKRMSDNQFVKLLCCKCHRSDFSSVQGFLNHCRIAHKIDYKSHEAAAQDCGQPLEPHETELAEQMHAPLVQATHARVTAAPAPISVSIPSGPARVTHTVPPSSRIHWLNQTTVSNRLWKPRRGTSAKTDGLAPIGEAAQVEIAAATSAEASAFQNAPFTPSSSTPFLSAHFQRHGIGGDLETAAAKAKERQCVESDVEMDDDEPGSHDASPVKNIGNKPSSDIAAANHGSVQSRKGYRQPMQRMPQDATDFATSFHSESSGSGSNGMPRDIERSPHTADSNPGLVSDHDDDPASEPEEIAAPADEKIKEVPIPMGGTCGDAADEMDIQDDDSHDEHGVLIRRRDMMMNDSSNNNNG